MGSTSAAGVLSNSIPAVRCGQIYKFCCSDCSTLSRRPPRLGDQRDSSRHLVFQFADKPPTTMSQPGVWVFLFISLVSCCQGTCWKAKRAWTPKSLAVEESRFPCRHSLRQSTYMCRNQAMPSTILLRDFYLGLQNCFRGRHDIKALPHFSQGLTQNRADV